MKSSRRGPGRWMLAMLASTVLVITALAALAVLVRPEAKPAEHRLSRLEQEASARFTGSEPYVTLPDGRRVPPANPAHALQMKVNAFQGILAKEAEQRDPTFHLKAEAELERRRPMRVAIEWTDVTGNRAMDFNLEDSSTCALGGRTELTVMVEDVGHYPCLARGGVFWEAGTKLAVHLTPVSKDDPLWAELLYSTKKAMATEAHMDDLETPKGP